LHILINVDPYWDIDWPSVYAKINESLGDDRNLGIKNLIELLNQLNQIEEKLPVFDEIKCNESTKSKIINITQEELDLHRTTFAGMEHILRKDGPYEVYAYVKPNGLEMSNSTIWAIEMENLSFDIMIALKIQGEIIKRNNIIDHGGFSGTFDPKKRKIISDQEFIYLKANPIIEGKDIRNQNLKTLRILKNTRKMFNNFENGKEITSGTFYSKNDVIIIGPTCQRSHSKLFGDNQHMHHYTKKNILGFILMKPNKRNVEIIISIMKSIYRYNYRLYLPVYNLNEDVLWPR